MNDRPEKTLDEAPDKAPDKAPAGLGAEEAARRLQSEGANALPSAPRRSLGDIVKEVATEPMMQLLAAAGVVYLLLGDPADAAMLLAFIVPTAAIAIVQQRRTEHALQALHELASPKALVLRDGQRLRIPGHEVVRGDLLLLADGDRIAADAVLVEAADLQADESLLTGESVPVRKRAAADPGHDAQPDKQATPGGEDMPWVWAGTMVVRGQGSARVVATGPRSEIGRIGRALGEVSTPPTPLAQRTRRLVRVFGAVGVALSLVVVLVYGLMRGDWLAAVLAGITLAMSMLPEEFPLILTVFMAMGAWRLSHHRVLARRAAAVEALGAATVLCTDKTGTLTANRMAVAALVLPPSEAPAPAAWQPADGPVPTGFADLLRAAALASESQPFDPMERAIGALAASTATAAAEAGLVLVHEFPLVPGAMAMTHVWRRPDGACTVACKGAPEAVAALCGLQGPEGQALRDAARDLASRGLRVLAVAGAETPWGDSPWPQTARAFGLRWLGLVALADPLRPEAAPAVAECRRAGVRVVMITGDHPATALAIAREAGIGEGDSVLTCVDLDAMDDRTLGERSASAAIYARVTPSHKLRIVQALRARGEVVAMTGDGVNDAPALKAAHIGIAMGGRGTDVAREAASVVLLDDDFSSLVRGVRLGRRIDDNLRKAMAFVLAVHVPIAAMTLLPLLLGWPPLLAPAHVAFLELLVDPVCSIVFEAEGEESDVMARPPRDPAAPLLAGGLVASALAQGGAVALGLAALQGALLHAGWGEGAVRSVVFTAMVACTVGMIFVNRSFGGPLARGVGHIGPALAVALGATTLTMTLVLALPVLRRVFRMDAISLQGLALALGCALALVGVLSAMRLAMRPRPGFLSR